MSYVPYMGLLHLLFGDGDVRGYDKRDLLYDKRDLLYDFTCSLVTETLEDLCMS